MDTRIRDLLRQIGTLEDELRTALHERQSQVHFTLRGKRIEFERGVRRAHRSVKRGIVRWLADRPQNLLTGPVIYALGIPLLLLDLCLTFYQASCFPIYGIAKAARRDYIVFDRYHLGYLNAFERFHCEYCAYANGLLAYATEIAARTELYFCPIKHARKVLGTHARYERFLEYGDATEFHARLESFRVASADEPHSKGPAAGKG